MDDYYLLVSCYPDSPPKPVGRPVQLAEFAQLRPTRSGIYYAHVYNSSGSETFCFGDVAIPPGWTADIQTNRPGRFPLGVLDPDTK